MSDHHLPTDTEKWWETVTWFLADWRLEPLYWLAGIILAFFALLTIRQHTRHTRASFLLQVTNRFENLTEGRDAAYGVLLPIVQQIYNSNDKIDPKKEEKIRVSCGAELKILRNTHDKKYEQCLVYLDFFETLGIAVKNRYIPLSVIVQMYEGPIFDIERVFSHHIADWQSEGGTRKGLLEHLLFLIRKSKCYTERKEQLEGWLGGIPMLWRLVVPLTSFFCWLAR